MLLNQLLLFLHHCKVLIWDLKLYHFVAPDFLMWKHISIMTANREQKQLKQPTCMLALLGRTDPCCAACGVSDSAPSSASLCEVATPPTAAGIRQSRSHSDGHSAGSRSLKKHKQDLAVSLCVHKHKTNSLSAISSTSHDTKFEYTKQTVSSIKNQDPNSFQISITFISCLH